MKQIYLQAAIVFALLPLSLVAQLSFPPDGDNRKATVSERVGITDIQIQYDRPAVKGREGKIWGALVPFGYNDLGFGTSKAAPWRAGANENTTIRFSTDVTIEGQPLSAGTYGFFIATDTTYCTLIFSRNHSSWGSFFYDPKEDALQVKVKQTLLDKPVEWLKYEFIQPGSNHITVALQWEYWSIPFKIEVDYIKTQLESIRRELRSDKGFVSTVWTQAARFCVQHNVNLEEALQWADYGINGPFVGVKNFQTLSAKAAVFNKLNRQTEADALMKEALPLAQMNEVHNYARSLLNQKRSKEAFDIFKMNYTKYPDNFTTNMGMARGYSATGDFKKALEFAEKALKQAPDPGNKVAIEGMLQKLKAGKDIN